MNVNNVASILKGRFEDGGMPLPKYGLNGRMSNHKQIDVCVINTWISMNGASHLLRNYAEPCIDEEEISNDTDTLIRMSRLVDMTTDYSMEETFESEYSSKLNLTYEEFMAKYVIRFLKEYIDAMKNTNSKFFLNALRVRYKKLAKEDTYERNSNVTVFKHRTV